MKADSNIFGINSRSIVLFFTLLACHFSYAGALLRVVDRPSPSDPSEVASITLALTTACRIPIENAGDRHVIQMDRTTPDILKKEFSLNVNCPVEIRKGQGLAEIHFANRSPEGVSSLMINAPVYMKGITIRAPYSNLLVQFGSLMGEPPLAWLSHRSEFENILLEGRNLTSLIVQKYRYPLIVKNLLPQEGERKGVWLEDHAMIYKLKSGFVIGDPLLGQYLMAYR